ncbi:MAG: hypothetical protein OXP71_09645 [Candidatus Poribacteria bacterium]|nr:hypothetical protein [Candidatus Poribacteria bacterium]
MNRICLQITDRTIRKSDMVWGSGRWTCVQSDSRQLTADDAISDPLSYPDLADVVRELLADAKSKPVLISLSSSEILLKWIELPNAIPQADPQMQNLAVKTLLENETYIPIALGGAAYDFQLLSPKTLLIAWMRKGRLVSFFEQLAGVDLIYLSPQSVTVANQLLWYGSNRMCGVHIDGAMCDLAVVDSGDLCLGRSFFFGDASQLLRTIRQSLVNCPNPRDAPLTRIVLFRGSSVLTANQLAEQFGVEVTESSFDWAAALSKPMQESGRADSIRLNLLEPVLAAKTLQQKLRRKRRLMQAIPIAAMLMLAGANVKLYDWIQSKHANIHTMRLDRSAMKRLQAETESLGERHAAHQKSLAQLAWGKRQFPPLAERLVQLANPIPASVRLTEIKTVSQPKSSKARADFDARKELLVVGVAPSQAEINAYRAALVTQSQFASVRQVKTEPTLIDGNRRLEFTLALTSVEGE